MLYTFFPTAGETRYETPLWRYLAYNSSTAVYRDVLHAPTPRPLWRRQRYPTRHRRRSKRSVPHCMLTSCIGYKSRILESEPVRSDAAHGQKLTVSLSRLQTSPWRHLMSIRMQTERKKGLQATSLTSPWSGPPDPLARQSAFLPIGPSSAKVQKVGKGLGWPFQGKDGPSKAKL